MLVNISILRQRSHPASKKRCLYIIGLFNWTACLAVVLQNEGGHRLEAHFRLHVARHLAGLHRALQQQKRQARACTQEPRQPTPSHGGRPAFASRGTLSKNTLAATAGQEMGIASPQQMCFLWSEPWLPSHFQSNTCGVYNHVNLLHHHQNSISSLAQTFLRGQRFLPRYMCFFFSFRVEN